MRDPSDSREAASSESTSQIVMLHGIPAAGERIEVHARQQSFLERAPVRISSIGVGVPRSDQVAHMLAVTGHGELQLLQVMRDLPTAHPERVASDLTLQATPGTPAA
jgi:hypothetical protein